MWILYDNIVTFAIAILAGTFAWLYGGLQGSVLTPVVPWLTVFLVELMLCFPQRFAGETAYSARERLWRSLKEDPLVWVTLGFIVLLMIPFVNKGLCPVCDYAEIEFSGANPKPPVPFIPFCVNRSHHLTVVMWFVPALLAMIAVKHSLLKRGKRLLLELIVWNGLALGVFGAVQQLLGAEAPLWSPGLGRPVYFFSTFGLPNVGGDYFTTIFGLSIALWRWKVDKVWKENGGSTEADSSLQTSHKTFWRKHLLLIPAVIAFFSAMMTLSRAAIVMSSMLAVVFFIHAFVSFFARMPRAQRVRASGVSLIVLVLIAVCTVAFLPDNIHREIDTIDTVGVIDRVSGKHNYQTRVAVDIWKEHFFFGTGGWGYKHFALAKMKEQEIRAMHAYLGNLGTENIHNDYLQFLVEHGFIGFACLVVIVVMLVWPLGRMWRALLSVVRFTPPKEQPPPPVAIFVIPAPVFCILMTATATFLHGFGDCPLRSPAVLMLFFCELAAMDGFLPRLKEQ